MPNSQYGVPLFVGSLGVTAPAQGLKRVRLDKGGAYDEAWLQRIIMQHPGLLPIEQIEPAFVPAIPICMELSVPSGFVDNLYATPTGDLIVGETKLFRNPEARREVVGQIIDYAKDLSGWTYTELDAGVRRAISPSGDGKANGLYATVAAAVGAGGVEEGRFVDAISRNLARGRFLLLVIGDGIQEGTEGITRFLQDHAQLHFTFGLVELAIYELPMGSASGYLVQPRIIARTFNIDRGTYAIDGEKIVFRPPIHKATSPSTPSVPKRTTITEEKFYEELDAASPGVGQRLKAFMAKLESLNVYAEFGTSSLILRWRLNEDIAWNLASVTTSARVWTELLNAQADRAGLLHLSHQYLERLAASVPGATVKQGSKPTSSYVAKAGTYIMIDDLLAHQEAWYQAIVDFTTAASAALTMK